MPIYTNIAGSDQPAPIESTPVTPGEGDLAAVSKGFQQAPSEVAAQAGLRALAGGAHVSQADAVKQMTEQGYADAASHIPADGLTSDALHMIMNRQSILKRDDYALARSGNGGIRQFVGQMIGGLPDPINAAAWIFAPEAKVGQTFAAKFATGAAVQGGVNAASSLATMPLAHAIGDDYSMSDVFTQTTLGVLLGGFGHGFSKGVAPAAALTTDMVRSLERSAAYAKQHGISPDEVISHAGAVGVHQVMPSTARGLGLKGTDAEITEQLKNPAVNKATSQKLLDQLANDTKLKGDPEAQAIAYNDGPKAAYKWIKAGRDDSVLKPETAGYVKRLRELTGTSRIDTRTPQAVPQGAQEEAAPPVASGKTPAPGSQEAGLVVARRMPDGTVKYGKPGDLHFNLLDEEDDTERAATGYVGLEEGDMGFAKPGGPFMSREEAAASIGKTGRLESVKYNEGEPGAFGKRGDLPSRLKEFMKPDVRLRPEGASDVADAYARDYVQGKWRGDSADDRVVQQYAANHPQDIEDAFARLKGKRNVVSEVPPQIQPDLLKTAIAQAGDDSKVNVEPVLKRSVAEMYGVKNPSDFDPRGVTESIPQPGSAEHAPISDVFREALAKLDALTVQVEKSTAAEKGPLASEAQKALANDTAELKAIPEGIRKEGEPETVAADNAIKQNEELHKATEAAVRCGLTRGLG